MSKKWKFVGIVTLVFMGIFLHHVIFNGENAVIDNSSAQGYESKYSIEEPSAPVIPQSAEELKETGKKVTDAVKEKATEYSDSETLNKIKEKSKDLLNSAKDGISDYINENSESSVSGEYKREYFGESWIDVDKNGCDTRNDILNRDLMNKVKEGRCKVTSGELIDPYSGEYIDWTRGTDNTQNMIDIDHIVPLKYAYDHGANEWTQKEREAFANDPENLIAVSASENRSKSASGPSDWVPSAKSARCEYVQNFQKVANKYNMTLPKSDTKAIKTYCS